MHQQGCLKTLRDVKLARVEVRRVRCVQCHRTYRIYPTGVSRGQQSDAVKALSVLLYILGLSYGDVSDALARLGLLLAKTTVFNNVQDVGYKAQKARSDWLASGYGIDRVVSADGNQLQLMGRSTRVAVAVKAPVGVEVFIELDDVVTGETTEPMVQRVARATGALWTPIEPPASPPAPSRA
ncbi:MAG: hypothetical protein HY675_19210 [Chloroflexi bacterium]|nr:hypothetical protein [Chloroflexota bacterium]